MARKPRPPSPWRRSSPRRSWPSKPFLCRCSPPRPPIWSRAICPSPSPARPRPSQQLTPSRRSPGAFEVTKVADAAAADETLRNREAYAAFIARPRRRRPAHRLGRQPDRRRAAHPGRGPARRDGKPVPVTDVVAPRAPTDARGAGFAAGFLPLALITHARRDRA